MKMTKDLKEYGLALLALGGLGLASHSTHAHASTATKPAVFNQSQQRAQSNTKQMNYLANPRTNKVYSRQTTPRIVTSNGMAQTRKVATPAPARQNHQKVDINALALMDVVSSMYGQQNQPKAKRTAIVNKRQPIHSTVVTPQRNRAPHKRIQKKQPIHSTVVTPQRNQAPHKQIPKRTAIVYHHVANHKVAPVLKHKAKKVSPQHKLQFAYQKNGRVYRGVATWAQLNKDKNLPVDTTVIDNHPKVIKNNLTEAYHNALRTINNDRASNGLKKLTTTPVLNKLATQRAQQLEQKWGHYNSKGVSYEDIDATKLGLAKNVPDASYHMSENIAMIMLSPDAVMPSDPNVYKVENGNEIASSSNDSMYDYDGHESNWAHRMNILNPDSTQVGIGTAYDPKTATYFISEDFYQPKVFTSQKQINDYYAKAMDTLSNNDFVQSDKIACEQAGRVAYNNVINNHGTKAQAVRAYKLAFSNFLKQEIQK